MIEKVKNLSISIRRLYYDRERVIKLDKDYLIFICENGHIYRIEKISKEKDRPPLKIVTLD